MDHCGGFGSLRVSGVKRVWDWRLAALRGPSPNISPMPFPLPAIQTRPDRHGFRCWRLPPGLPPSGWATASPFSGQWKRTAIWFALWAGVARIRRQPARSPCQASPSPGRGAQRRASHFPSGYQARAYNRTTAWSPARPLVSRCAISAFSRHFPGLRCPLLGPKRRRWHGPSTPAGSTFTVSPPCPRCGSPAPAGETGGRWGQCSFCHRQDGGLSSARGGGSLQLILAFARSFATLGFLIQFERAPPARAG